MARRYGNQEPTFSVIGDYAYTDGGSAVEIFSDWGVRFYPSQEMELGLFLARDNENRYASKTIGISKPRQNGKSYGARHYAVWMAVVEGAKVLFSAHHGKTVRKMFKAICDMVEGIPELHDELLPGNRGIYRAGGYEGIYFRNGGLIEFQTRTAAGGRGDTYDVIIVDEAQELTDDQLEALKPTTLASESGDPQTIYLGTPPSPKCPGTVFRDLHDRAHKGKAGGSWWMEWAVDEIPDMDNRDEVINLAYMTNPAMGYRIREDVLLDAMDTVRPDGFAREYLGWWSDVQMAQHVIPVGDWTACATDSPPMDGVTVYAVKFSADGSVGTLSACVKPKDGLPYVEVIANQSLSHGIGGLADWLIARKGEAANIVVDGKSNASALVDRLIAGKVSKKAIVTPSSSDVVAAYSTMLNLVKERGVTHYGQPALDASATLSERRSIGSNGGFGFRSNEKADATLIESCSLALWQALRTKRNPKRKQRIG